MFEAARDIMSWLGDCAKVSADFIIYENSVCAVSLLEKNIHQKFLVHHYG